MSGPCPHASLPHSRLTRIGVSARKYMAPGEIPFRLVSVDTMEVSFAALEVAAAICVRNERRWSIWIPRLLMVVALFRFVRVELAGFYD